jgi:hypothetical protein
MTNDRDRDEGGRPRNARPRDASGRPLPRDAVGVTPVDDTSATTPEATLVAAQEAVNDGRPFAAHEILEAAWHRAEPAERDLWQGLAQLAVGLTHAQRGNTSGAHALLLRGTERLTAYAGTTPYGIHIDAVCATARGLADAVERGMPSEGLKLQLRG